MAESTNIEWAEPPRSKSRGGEVVHQGFRAALMAEPKRWAKYPSSPIGASVVTRIRRTWQPVGAWEATSRSVGNGLADVYVRYVGESS